MLRTSRVRDDGSKLALWIRIYIYGLQGFFLEILFTAGWEFVVSGNWKLPGYTSVWSLAIYGISGVVMEHIYAACAQSRVPLVLRGLCYLVWVYAWEFSTGLLLKQFNACPWDYSEFSFNVRGLITFEYAPLWFLVSLLMERVIAHVSELRWAATSPSAGKSHNGLSARLKD
ncbi:transmembrane protein 229B-like isoform X2 [Periplaneta americana]